ncbi:MAG: class I SAM-dependent methyltransferase [Longimicrobiales bacterium]
MSAPAPTPVAADASADAARDLLIELLQLHGAGEVAARFWDGSTWPVGDAGAARCTLVLKQAGAVRAILTSRDDGAVGEAYAADLFDIEGDIDAALAFGERLLAREWSAGEWLGLAWRARRLPRAASDGAAAPRPRLRGRRHTLERDRAAVRHHYDVANQFYALWLDRRMVYTCAYFAAADEDLDSAQLRKLDYVCRKLRLEPGERLLDIGCGWGSLLLHAAAEYGVDAHGITLSEAQASLARERIREAGLDARCTVEIRDYRELEGVEAYDKIASIGMFEHVGERRMGEFFRRAWAALRPGGVFLNHAIAGNPRTAGRDSVFSRRHVFPDHDIIPLATTLRGAEAAGFEVRDVESLREHYALTLRHWVRRLEAQHDEAARAAGESTYRAWRLVLAGAARRFDSRELSVYQTLLAKPRPGGAAGLPLTREDWYHAG